MDDQQLQEIADWIVVALQNLAPRDTPLWFIIVSFAPLAAFAVAAYAAWVGWRNLKQQQVALAAQMSTHESTLTQKREADARSEWWRFHTD